MCRAQGLPRVSSWSKPRRKAWDLESSVSVVDFEPKSKEDASAFLLSPRFLICMEFRPDQRYTQFVLFCSVFRVTKFSAPIPHVDR